MRLVSLFVALLLSLPAFSAQVSGRVYVRVSEDNHSRALSAQAWTPVYLDSVHSETDSNGAYVFHNVQPGRHVLRCEVLGTRGAYTSVHVTDKDVSVNAIALPLPPDSIIRLCRPMVEQAWFAISRHDQESEEFLSFSRTTTRCRITRAVARGEHPREAGTICVFEWSEPRREKQKRLLKSRTRITKTANYWW
jgi:hypothetical protein